MAGRKDPKVTEGGGYIGHGPGPNVDTASYDNRTPMGGDGYRSMDSDAEEPVYVIDENKKKPAMLARDQLTQGGHAPEDEGGAGSDIKMMLLAGIAFVFILLLGVVGIGFALSGSDIERIEAQVAAEHATDEPPPEDIQGVKVRKGMKHQPNAPAKRSDLEPGEVDEQVEELPPNSVPSGERPAEEAAPTEAPDGAPE